MLYLYMYITVINLGNRLLNILLDTTTCFNFQSVCITYKCQDYYRQPIISLYVLFNRKFFILKKTTFSFRGVLSLKSVVYDLKDGGTPEATFSLVREG